MANRKMTRAQTFTAQARRQRPAAALVVLDPPIERGRSAPIHPDGIRIGRAPSNGLVLTDPGASRKHAIVHAQGGEYVIEDRHSLNGTFVNGERITTPQALHDGDQIQFGRLVAEFRLVDPVGYRPDRGLRDGEDWHPDRWTEPIGRPPVPTLREGLRDSAGFSFGALALAVLGSVVATVLVAVFQGDGADQNANWRLAAAALGPIISTTFTTRQAGEKGQVRAATIVLLSSAALAVSVTGFRIGDEVNGGPVLPGVTHGDSLPMLGLWSDGEDQGSTKPDEPGEETDPPSPGSAPEIVVNDTHACGAAEVDEQVRCDPLVVRNAGDAPLSIGSVVVQDAHEFDVTGESTCSDSTLQPDTVCEVHIDFRPADTGDRVATLVIEHDAAGTPTPVTLTGVGEGAVEPGQPEPEDPTGSG